MIVSMLDKSFRLFSLILTLLYFRVIYVKKTTLTYYDFASNNKISNKLSSLRFILRPICRINLKGVCRKFTTYGNALFLSLLQQMRPTYHSNSLVECYLKMVPWLKCAFLVPQSFSWQPMLKLSLALKITNQNLSFNILQDHERNTNN